MAGEYPQCELFWLCQTPDDATLALQAAAAIGIRANIIAQGGEGREPLESRAARAGEAYRNYMLRQQLRQTSSYELRPDPEESSRTAERLIRNGGALIALQTDGMIPNLSPWHQKLRELSDPNLAGSEA